MAIHPYLGIISASILVDGEPAIEHPDTDDVLVEHDDPTVSSHQQLRKVSTYVKSISNKEFSIIISVGPPYGGMKMDCSKLRFHIKVDGVEAWVSTCERVWWKRFNRNEQDAVWEDEITGIKQGKWRGCTRRNFKFAEIKKSKFNFSICIRSTYTSSWILEWNRILDISPFGLFSLSVESSFYL